MTECKQYSLQFHPHGRREVVAEFDGGRITSDAGGLLLREVNETFGVIRQFATCFRDYRDPHGAQCRARVLHPAGQPFHL